MFSKLKKKIDEQADQIRQNVEEYSRNSSVEGSSIASGASAIAATLVPPANADNSTSTPAASPTLARRIQNDASNDEITKLVKQIRKDFIILIIEYFQVTYLKKPKMREKKTPNIAPVASPKRFAKQVYFEGF